jgi:hypothetical protein
MGDDGPVAALAIILSIGGPIAAIIILRVLKHRERLEMIRHGMVPPYSGREARNWYRQNPPGMAAAPPPPRQHVYVPPDIDSPERSLQKGIRIGLIGFAIFLGLRLGLGSHTPALLFGLVPMFVGLAQIIIAVLAGAQISIPNGFIRPPGMPPPAAPPPPYPGARPQPQAQPYNPGPEPTVHTGYEELIRPVPPPERR